MALEGRLRRLEEEMGRGCTECATPRIYTEENPAPDVCPECGAEIEVVSFTFEFEKATPREEAPGGNR